MSEDQCRREFENDFPQAFQDWQPLSKKYIIYAELYEGYQACWNCHESDRRDSQRYRFLSKAYFDGKSTAARIGPAHTAEELNSAVDAAIEKEQGGQ